MEIHEAQERVRQLEETFTAQVKQLEADTRLEVELQLERSSRMVGDKWGAPKVSVRLLLES